MSNHIFPKPTDSAVYTPLPTSDWKSSLETEKRPRLDWTKTAQDRKFSGLSKTATAVQSLVSHDRGNFKTDKRQV
jgi:hypothetical protein